MHKLVSIREQIIGAGNESNQEQNYKREILDLFRDYRHPWDILSEIVQNSVDAINDNNSIEKGRIDIIISPEERTFVIKDNGIGISEENIEKVLVPNFSLNKESSRTFGYKGVGLSFVSHLTKKFIIESVQNNKKTVYTLENTIDWVADIPNANATDEKHTSEEITESYTKVTVTLSDNYADTGIRALQSLNEFFTWVNNPKILEFVLRTRTAVGNTKKYLKHTPKKEIEVYLTIDKIPQKIDFNYLSPFLSDYSKHSRYFLKETIDKNPKYEDLFQNAAKRDSDKMYRCLRHDFKDLEVGSQVRTKTRFDLSVLVCGETGVTQLEEQYEINKLGPTNRQSFQMNTGIYLSVNGMPTDINLFRWADGFKKRFLCLVDVDMSANGELDKGRKGISEHTKNLIISLVEEKLREKIVDKKYSLYQLAQRMNESQTKGYGGADTLIHKEKWERTPSIIENLSISKAPLDENACIFIFAELLGRGDLQGYDLVYISQDATYDFAFQFKVLEDRLDSNNYSLSQGFVDRLGRNFDSSNGILRGPRGEDYHVGEFKIDVEEIVGKESQPIANLDLLIAWDFDEEEISSKGGTITQVTADQRKYEGVTHILRDQLGECQVICLKTLLFEMGYIKE
jgi:anti-sigma regulatory factor (Ser/Thr protein kinase)